MAQHDTKQTREGGGIEKTEKVAVGTQDGLDSRRRWLVVDARRGARHDRRIVAASQA